MFKDKQYRVEKFKYYVGLSLCAILFTMSVTLVFVLA